MPHVDTILIIDDTPANLAVLVEHLEERGLRVVIAQDGSEGLERAEYVRPDLILLDVMMPGIDGFETCRQLKAAATTRDVPVIFMTALEDASHKILGFGAGAVDYVTKPLHIAEVSARVGAHLALRVMQRLLADQNSLLQHEIVVREQTERSLQAAREELEQRVAHRTADLAKANLALMAEVSERACAEEAIREREARIRRLVESNIIGVFFWDLSGVITYANDAFLRIVGYTRDELQSGQMDWSKLTPAEYRAADTHASDELARTARCTPYEKEYFHKNGHRIPALIGRTFFEGSKNQGVAFVVDLSERKRAEKRIRHMAHHDALTGLPNRVLFRDRLNQSIALARRNDQRVAVLFADLDHFKHINDSLGHHIGDRLLRVAGRRLKRCLRAGDTVARLGGDEFVIGLPALTDNDDAMVIADKVLQALREPFRIDGQELHVTGSIGISLYPGDALDTEGLMRAADTAMYHAKDRGRDNYQFFLPRLNEAVQRRLTIANLLHHALQRGELQLHYQPQVRLPDGKIFAAEALVRWQPPELGPIPAAEFIKVAEDTALVVPLGEWVIRTACAQLSRWRAAGYPDLCIAVNLSPYQFRRPGMAELIATVLKETGLPPSALEMEITEGVLVMQNFDNISLLKQLAGMGVRLAVDDFGTGYSSLAYLQRLPLHALKVDQSFVSGIGEDPNDTAIVTAIIAMAQNLHLQVIAEGVENREQIAFLQKHGCFAAQGFYYSKAVTAEAFTALLRGEVPIPQTREGVA
ncbi:MAG: EAL domain-containing protein [Gammaproteobacteria bacterium]|nr:EAL domain-containing protein [Gammaproteobacteria bacterium]